MMHKFCPCGRILTIEQMKTTLLCDKCGKKHAEDFHRKFGIKGIDPLKVHKDELLKGGY